MSSHAGNSRNDSIPGSTAPRNVPAFTSYRLRVSITTTSSDSISAFQSPGSTYCPTSRSGATGTPSVTISRFRRTLNRLNGCADAPDSLYSSPAKPSASSAACSASIPARLPATVPLIPSDATINVPQSPASPSASSRSRNPAGSATARN